MGREGGLNGVGFEADLWGVFTEPTAYPERRVGFADHEEVTGSLEADTEFDPEHVPAESDLSMGFNPLYENSVPRETNATIVEDQKPVEPKPPGVFTQGTVQHVSKLDVDLSEWYGDHETEERRKRMFSPHHTENDVGTAGENLGNSNASAAAPTRSADGDDLAERVQADAESGNVLGHTQKIARARFDLEKRLTEDAEGAPTVERADDPGVTRACRNSRRRAPARRRHDRQNTPGVHFIALMRFNGYMSYVRQAMNGVEFDTDSFGLDGDARIKTTT